ncbi:DNA polymerase beta-like [Eurytemora carolleeae]|uniref:DNA polymerase beta-like n=1 Tax=Eurytemora carolleeae TaxID=1294199 RepID=UPI000C776B2B|nr:DNA polymerase beta-like [Eurytemora carolleeae]|eukprot:XP_023341808.1 DNA polymerase beta-like [Eurytemora affinis]
MCTHANTERMSLKRKAESSKSGGENLNSDFSSALLELAEWEKNVNRNQFKSAAYRKAATVVSGLDYRLTSGADAAKLPGIGKKIAEKIDEMIDTGKLRKLENIREDDSTVAINLLTRVSGIGPAKARELFDAGITNLEQLKKQHIKLNHAQKIGLKHFEDFELRIPRAEITKIFNEMEKILKKLDQDYVVTVCGSYRRETATSGDIDVLLTHKQFKHADKHHGNLLHRVVDRLEKEGLITERISEGETKFMGVCKLKQYDHYRRLDIRLLPLNQYYCGILYFTGSDVFNKKMRTWALSKGFTLNEYSLRPLEEGVAGEPLPVSSEQDIFEYLDYPYKEPKDRA